MAEKKAERLYYIVESSALSTYGNENGSTKEEAERLLKEAGGDAGSLVVIKGELIVPTFKLD